MRPDLSCSRRSKDNLASFITASSRSDAVIAEFMRQKIRRDLSRWSRKVLLCLGLENIGKHIVGESKWEKLYDNGCTRKCPTPEQESEEVVLNDSSMEPSKEASEKNNEETTTPPKEGISEQEDAVDEQETAVEDEEDEDRGDDSNRRNSQTVVEGDAEESVPNTQNDEENLDDEKKDGEASIEEKVLSNDTSSNNSIAGECSTAREASREVLREDDEIHNTNTSRSGSSPSQEPNEPVSPSGSEVVDQDDGAGGNLASNLFQILPYWYFLNRAFSMGSAEGGGPPPFDMSKIDPRLPLNEAGMKDEDREPDEDEEMEPADPSTSSRHSLNQEDDSNSCRSPDANQRINSLILLESLQQRLRTQEQGRSTDASALNHGLYLSQLLSRMTGREGNSGSGKNGTLAGSFRAEHLDDAQTLEHALDEQPLDLRSSTLKERSDEETDAKRRREDDKICHMDTYPGQSSSLGLPYMLDETTSKVFRSNPRSSKGYTAQELQAALHDIQSGKLGTRRAAVIYGIPRSTLRNKVYKLGKDRGRSLQLGVGVPGGTDFLHLNNNNNNNNNINSLRNKEAVMRKELLGKLSHFRPLTEGFQCPSNNDTEPANIFGGQRSSAGAYSSLNGDHEPGLGGKMDVTPSLSHLILKHAQAQKRVQSLQGKGLAMSLDSEDGAMRGTAYKSVEHHGSPFLAGKDWKDALVRHELLLQQQQQQQQQHDQRHHPPPGVGGHSGRAPPQTHLGGSNADDSSSGMDLAGKKSRPKRGKYRNYDREALVKAVRAVQNGEMSVHRAGSFFGVPHSTLEYKVKERHLLRRPKRKELTSPSLAQAGKLSATESSSESMMAGVVHGLSRGEDQSSSSFPAKPQTRSGAGVSGQIPQNSHLFPVTTDLRESLSRYLNAEHSSKQFAQNDEMDDNEVDSEDGGRNDGNNSPPTHHYPRSVAEERLLRRKEENGESDPSTASAASLGGLIGNRLSDLFQLSDIFFRAGGNDSTPLSREALLDLSKK